MKIVKLSPEQFDNFSNNHPLHTYYQTSNYGNLMSNEGFEPHYYGFINDQNILIGASLILIQKLFLGYKYAYAPRGYLIDYDNKDLIIDVTNKMKKFLAKNNIIFLKIDPPVVNNKRDRNGNIIKSPYTAETLFDNFDPSVKNKIRKAQSRGVEILQGNHGDIETFYKFVAKKHYRKLNYYKEFADSFKDNFELYFAKLNTEKYLNNIKQIYEQELQKNEEINSHIQEAGLTGKISNKLTNSKITSDKVLAIYKKELETASSLLTKNPQGIIISTCAVIIEKHGVILVIEGQNGAYKLYYPTFLTKWAIIEK